jgi:hypothetical protein
MRRGSGAAVPPAPFFCENKNKILLEKPLSERKAVFFIIDQRAVIV